MRWPTNDSTDSCRYAASDLTTKIPSTPPPISQSMSRSRSTNTLLTTGSISQADAAVAAATIAEAIAAPTSHAEYGRTNARQSRPINGRLRWSAIGSRGFPGAALIGPDSAAGRRRRGKVGTASGAWPYGPGRAFQREGAVLVGTAIAT